MKRHMPPLNHLRALEAAVRLESFTKAAEELHVTQGAISRHVRALEEYLGFELVERVNNNLIIPPECQKFARALTQAFDGINKASKELKEARRRTILIVRAYTNFVLRWLVPRLPEFQKLNPEIEIRISAGGTDIDFEDDDVDLAVRYGLGQWSDAHSDLLFGDELLPVCSPLVAQSSRFLQPEDLLQATLYHSYHRREEWPRWLKQTTGKALLPERSVYLEDQAVAHECVLAGMGVGLAQRHFIEHDVRAGRLVVLFDLPLRNPEGYYLLVAPDRMHSPSIATFRTWLLQHAPSPEAGCAGSVTLEPPAT